MYITFPPAYYYDVDTCTLFTCIIHVYRHLHMYMYMNTVHHALCRVFQQRIYMYMYDNSNIIFIHVVYIH